MDMNSQFVQANDFELHDFTDDANFDQFIDLIRGENKEQISGFDCDLINGLLADNQFDNHDPPGQEGIFNFSPDACTNSILLDQAFAPFTLPTTLHGDMKQVDEDTDGDEDSSATTTTTPTTRKTKTDRSRTLISERRRRGNMKEKLYALRSLVPNITKMDKASIIGDAVLYVQELQMQAKKLRADIVGLEASLVRSERYQGLNKNPRKIQVANNIINNPSKKIMQMNVFQVEERGFYVKLECDKGYGVAGSLYRTLESLTSFKIQSSNLTTVSDRFVLTFNLNVKEREMDMNLPNLKLWITGALLNQGFELTSSCA